MQPFKYNPNYNSGQFRHRITFLLKENSKDELGQVIKDELGQEETVWKEVNKAWAKVVTIKGSEYVAAGAEQSSLVVRFILHYIPGITSDMRINFNGRIFDIIEPPINDDELDKTLTIIARERR